MKKIIPAFLMIIMCLTLCSCGKTTLSGNPVTYSNADKSFSIDLPTEEKSPWVINEETTGDVLDISDADDIINIQVQCLSKNQTKYIADNLDAYQDYAMVNTIGELASDMKLKDADVEAPEFIVNSKAQSFTLKSGSNTVKGNLIFLESKKCYYTYLIMALDEAYDGNKKVLLESVLSLKELTDSTSAEDTKEGSEGSAE